MATRTEQSKGFIRLAGWGKDNPKMATQTEQSKGFIRLAGWGKNSASGMV